MKVVKDGCVNPQLKMCWVTNNCLLPPLFGYGHTTLYAAGTLQIWFDVTQRQKMTTVFDMKTMRVGMRCTCSWTNLWGWDCPTLNTCGQTGETCHAQLQHAFPRFKLYEHARWICKIDIYAERMYNFKTKSGDIHIPRMAHHPQIECFSQHQSRRVVHSRIGQPWYLPAF